MLTKEKAAELITALLGQEPAYLNWHVKARHVYIHFSEDVKITLQAFNGLAEIFKTEQIDMSFAYEEDYSDMTPGAGATFDIGIYNTGIELAE